MPASPRTATIYERLKGAILTGALRPMERISEHQVAQRFGRSRTPVREAMRRLEAEGLLRVVPQRGSFVSQPGVDDLLEVYQIRLPLEAMCARIAAETLDAAQLKTLEGLVEAERRRGDRRSAGQSLAASRRFHAVVIGCVRNKRLTALLTDLQLQVHRARVLWPSTPGVLDKTWQDHAALVAALAARDGDLAERLMREHLERARANTLQRILPSASGVAGAPAP